ncbi:MAG: TetR/AcrR family transcriptional regulator [Propionibacteriaceae bacterium]|nr:TetR/AcrR family transcriptional regulator [Propionibacteriaceae bacterium]
MSGGSASRRRGDRLIESIYNAATEIIRTEGYGNLTFVRIARLAGTGRTVLYRRWATPLDLVREIMVYRSARALGGELIDAVKDTGSLRGDLLYLMELYQQIYIATGPEIMNALLFEMSQDNARMPVLKDHAVFKNVEVMDKLLSFARARGDRINDLSINAQTLPFDLIRMSFLWERRTLDEAEREKLVDEIVLPVFTGSAVTRHVP